MRLATLFTGLLAAITVATKSAAQDTNGELAIIGAPVDRAVGFQPAVTGVMRDIQWLDGMLLIVITAISVFVLALIALIIVRFNRRANPEPATFTHHTPVEVAWTIIPVVILVFIGAFSLPVLFNQQEIPEGDVVIKATGFQWYWGYEYVDEDIAYEGFMIGSDAANMLTPEVSQELADAGYSDREFLLATDTSVVIPTGQKIVVQVTGADVIHAWAIPAFGVKQDAVPGRLAELWFEVDEGREGVYFGQCSELCGLSHAYMPITVKAVSQADYSAWLDAVKAAGEYVEPPVTVASAE